MDAQQIDGWTVAKVLWGLLVTLFSFLGLRQLKRIDALEKNSVNKPDFREEMRNQSAARVSMHRENKEDGKQTRLLLDKIDNKIDASERRRAVVEHETLERIHSVAIRVEEVNTTAQQAVTAANAAANAASGNYLRLELDKKS